MWPSGQHTRPQCAVEGDTLSGRGLRVNLDAFVCSFVRSLRAGVQPTLDPSAETF